MTRTEIQALIDNGQYAEAATKALELLEGDLCKENWLLAAKAYILALPTDAVCNESSMGTFIHCTTNAILFANTLEELFEIQEELLGYIDLAERDCAQELLDSVAANVTMDSWQQYLLKEELFRQFRIQVNKSIVESTKCCELAAQENFPPEEMVEKYEKKGILFSNAEKNRMLHETFCRGFENIKAYYENNRHTNDLRGTCSVILRAIAVPTAMAKTCYELYAATAEQQKAWLIAMADINYFELNAVQHSSTISMSLIVDEESRKKSIQEIKSINEKICAIDPSYIAPPLPSEEPVKINHAASASSNTTSSGGCYVATAVYGSYDCPQVWTLRRYRDYTLAQTWYGRTFIRAYYAISPSLVKWFGQTVWFKKMWHAKLDHMVSKLQEKGVQSTPYSDKEW